ncbi:glucagon receptor [Callorhinchus milii]|uniref:glucagon receptor n=1 Tax=Callorhinchus milii TaxID=7868 RepID=UPI001C3F71B6|nr:glucagon receptor [Callorhinchus milii]XP_042198468.1 glucagon receptor [Callorhinchus milii]XP_042198469.1 glucagon receptor [Callorhinchus milii]XP_042198470.1 glucagon receptor [Callorhinchus milii]
MSQARFLLLLVALSMNFQKTSAKKMQATLEKWEKYSDECSRNMSRTPQPTGVVCNRTFDKYACWPDGLPDTIVNVSCPWYLPWYNAVENGSVYRKCGANGQWEMGPKMQPWRESSQCVFNAKDDRFEKKMGKILAGFKVMYTVGYSLSLGTLILALGILVGFRKLHCMRNYIHMNLFASFILRAVSILIRDALFKMHYTSVTTGNPDIKMWFNNKTAGGCKAAQVLMQYCIGANYYWLLVEGVYLHNLLVIAVFSEKSFFNIYLYIGWGAPVLFVVPWVVVKYLYENSGCWTLNENMAFWWIIRCPILLSILINFFIFIRIIHILVSKLRAHQMRYNDYKFRLAKSTLTLIPLLGIHEVVFAFFMDEHAQGTLRLVKLFFDLFLNSFQGMLVAILYCFVNREVQCELLKKWKRWKLGKDIEEEYRHTYSQTLHLRLPANLEKHKLMTSGAGAGIGAGMGAGGASYHNGTGRVSPTGPPCAERAPPSTEPVRTTDRLHCYGFPQEPDHKALCPAESKC